MPEPALQTTALRYAAGDLTPAEAGAFEARLAEDQDARDALGEAVRLSAAAIGQPAPKPHSAFRMILRERLSWDRYRGHPLAWAGAGAAVVAVCTLIGLSLAERAEPRAQGNAPTSARAVLPTEPVREVEVAPAPREATSHVAFDHPSASPCGGGEPVRTVAEIWADLSTPEHVEKTRDDELRLRQKMHNLTHPHPVTSASKADAP